MGVPGPTLLLILPPRCWLRLQSAVSENNTFEVMWGRNKAHDGVCEIAKLVLVIRAVRRCSWAPDSSALFSLGN